MQNEQMCHAAAQFDVSRADVSCSLTSQNGARCDKPSYGMRLNYCPDLCREHPFEGQDDIIVISWMNPKNGDFGNDSMDREDVEKLKDAGWRVHKLWGHMHSELKLSTSPFNDRWDSGLAGALVISPSTVAAMGEDAYDAYVDTVVKVLNDWIRGDYWLVTVFESDGCDVDVESTYGHQLNEVTAELAQRWNISLADVHEAIEKGTARGY